MGDRFGFDIDYRKTLVLDIIEKIDSLLNGDVIMNSGEGNPRIELNTKIVEMTHLKDGFGYMYSVRFLNPNGKNYDIWIMAKDQLRNTFNYIFNGDIDVAIFEEKNKLEFEIVSKY